MKQLRRARPVISDGTSIDEAQIKSPGSNFESDHNQSTNLSLPWVRVCVLEREEEDSLSLADYIMTLKSSRKGTA